MSLHGTFSYFPTRKPTDKELSDAANVVVLLTPEGPWNPNSTVFAENEDNMVDHKGKVIVPSHRPKRILLQDVEPDATFDKSLEVSTVEAFIIDQVADSRPTIGKPDLGEPSPFVFELDWHASAACFAAKEPLLALMVMCYFQRRRDALACWTTDMDDIMVKDAHATNSRSVSAENLCKILI